jgi:hypothetical protein
MALRDRSTPLEKYRVTLSVAERAALEHLVSQGKAAARKLTHARVLLLTDDSEGGNAPMTRSSRLWVPACGLWPGSGSGW